MILNKELKQKNSTYLKKISTSITYVLIELNNQNIHKKAKVSF